MKDDGSGFALIERLEATIERQEAALDQAEAALLTTTERLDVLEHSLRRKDIPDLQEIALMEAMRVRDVLAAIEAVKEGRE